MAIDVNGIYGHWPVRTPGIWEPGLFLRKMDRFGIERSLLTATAALLDHTTLGNDQTAAVIRRFPDRFLGAAVVNPHPGPEHAVTEARRCLDQGFVALRLFPAPHQYSLGDAEILDPVMEEAKRAGVPLLITLRVTGDTGFRETPAAGARAFAARHPDVPVILCGASSADRLLLTRAARACPNLHLEISQMQGADAVPMLCHDLGCARLLLGTGMGVLYAAPALRKVTASNLPEADRQAILDGNARRLLKIP